MNKTEACFVCDRGGDPSFFCSNCQNNFNTGNLGEALYDLGIAILKELRASNGRYDGNGGSTSVMNPGDFVAHLDDVGSRKIKVIKKVCDLTGLGLKESKDIVDHCTPFTVSGDEFSVKMVEENLREAGAIFHIT